jgi:hypothetical protein
MNQSVKLRGVGRKQIVSDSGTTLKPITLKLFAHQIEWLKAQKNGSAWLRKMIERAMRREAALTRKTKS